jgi:hypothetical protein
MSNLLTQGIFMFMMKGGSRNNMNNWGASDCMQENFSRLFPNMKWAHFDSVDEILRTIEMEDVEKVKTQMIKEMIRKKRIATMYGYYPIAVDATGVTTYAKDTGGNLLHKTTSGGKTTYLNYMLEAKIVTAEGLALSIASEPLSNEEVKSYEKQDCEQKAFKRLADKLKKNFPRLPICLLMDGLYANKTVFQQCETYGWRYLITLKDLCLPTLQEAIADTLPSERVCFEKNVVVDNKRKKKVYGTAKYQWITGLEHKGHGLNWLQCLWPAMPPPPPKPKTTKLRGIPTQKNPPPAEPRKFAYVTNLAPRPDSVGLEEILARIADCARLRWKIENEGFNCQKNNGYGLHHKYSRRSVKTLHVYYILLQIAHIINQLVVHSLEVAALLKDNHKLTVKSLWDDMISILKVTLLSGQRLADNERHCQIRLE